MRSGKFLIIFAASLFIAGVLTVCLSPLLVAGGVRWWAARAARQGHLQIELGNIQAPFLGPVVVHDLHLTSDSGAPFRIDAVTPRLEIDLNLAAALGLSDNRALRALRVDGITIDIRRNAPAAAAAPKFPWETLETLLSDNFRFSGVRLHAENGGTMVDVHDGTLSGSELEVGVFGARELAINSPWFSQTFSNLHGATSWQESHLVIGALSVMRGLDLDTINLDLSRIGESRLGIEVNLDAFGGKIRARVSSDDRGDQRIWDIAGNGSGVSLAQMSDALEWSNRASGSLHASKFTFRGEMNDLRNATAAIWAEVSGLTWRDRTADTVMIGASLYNREIQLEQLYLKQRDNQLTLSGEFAWPDRWTLATIPEFRGDVSASINNLGELARLVGWNPSEFAGTLTARGSIDARAGKFGGELSAAGNSLVLFHSQIESLDLKIGLAESRLEIAQFELHQQDDFLHAEGSIGLTGDHGYIASAKCSVGELGNYRGFIPPGILPFALGGGMTAEWKGRGANESDSGTIQVRGHSLHDVDNLVAPFDAELEADYSPDTIFFRQFHVWNSKADLAAFITVAKDYLHLQDLRLNLNGPTRFFGNVYLPFSVSKIRTGSDWLAALSSDPFFDVDLKAEALDFAELSAAVKTKPDMSGTAAGGFQISGTPASLQGELQFHLRDFVFDGEPPMSTDVETHLGLGIANVKATANLRSSEPVSIEASLPLQFQKRDAGYSLSMEGPLAATLDFPAILLTNLPRYLVSGVFTRGILSGKINISESVGQPSMTGGFNFIDARVLRGTSLSAGVRFNGRRGTIDFARIAQGDADISANGEIDFEDTARIDVALTPDKALDAALFGSGDCVSALEFMPQAPGNPLAAAVRRIDLRGGLSTPPWTVDLSRDPATDPESPVRSVPVCQEGMTLSLAPAPNWFP